MVQLLKGFGGIVSGFESRGYMVSKVRGGGGYRVYSFSLPIL